jgi:hypothetical protein
MNHKAIRELYPNVVSIDDTAGAMDADGNNVEIDFSLVNAWVDPEAYIGKRLAEYPTLQECVHAMLDGNLEELQAKRQAVKAKYPKGDT